MRITSSTSQSPQVKSLKTPTKFQLALSKLRLQRSLNKAGVKAQIEKLSMPNIFGTQDILEISVKKTPSFFQHEDRLNASYTATFLSNTLRAIETVLRKQGFQKTELADSKENVQALYWKNAQGVRAIIS